MKYGSQPDLIDQIRKLQEQVRRLQTRTKMVTSHSKTFLVSGAVVDGFQTPGFIVSATPRYFTDDTDPAERFPQDIRIVTGVSAKLLDGEAHLDFYVNSEVVFSDYWVKATRDAYWHPIRKDLHDGDLLSVVVVSTNGSARDLSAAFLMTLESWE